MNSIFNWNGRLKLTVPKSLLLGHSEARAVFVRANMEGGPVAHAANRVAQLCLPHFAYEEKIIFPVLALLPYLTPENLRPEMMEAMPLIADFRANQDTQDEHHEAILDAIEELLQAAHRAKSREFAEFAYNLRIHEKIEDEVIYPTIILIGNYLQAKLAN